MHTEIIKILGVRYDQLDKNVIKFITRKLDPTYRDLDMKEDLYSYDSLSLNDYEKRLPSKSIQAKIKILVAEMDKKDCCYLRLQQ